MELSNFPRYPNKETGLGVHSFHYEKEMAWQELIEFWEANSNSSIE